MSSYGQDRDYRRSNVEFEDQVRTRTITRSPGPPRARREYDEVDVRIRERDTDLPDFLRPRRGDPGTLVVRPREAESYDRHPRDQSPGRLREVRRAVSVSPSHIDHEHERTRTRLVERIHTPSTVRRRSPSPSSRSIRYVEPSDTEHIRIVERERERVPSPSPSPSPPPPQVIRGPVIEREVITHYRDIDHGVIQARPPTPPPAIRPRPRERESRESRETDIDISLSKHRTEVDIHRSTSRHRSRSRERRSRYDDDIVLRRELKVEDTKTRRRARSDAGRPDDEAEYITSKVDSRARMGEAWGGATKHWAIVDVPPGTERIRMDGAGGATTDTTWSKYSGVRRTQFVPERDTVAKAPTPPPASRESRLNVSVYDREREIDIEKVTDRRITRSPHPPPKDMWTEITKDLVVREAIEELGYEYEETDWFFYVMDYLKYDDVLHLTELSEEIRRHKKHRAREVRYERDYWDDHDRRYYDHQPRRQPRRDVLEAEVTYERGPARSYR